MKRSFKRAPVTLGLIGVSAFALAACKPEVTEVDAQMFPTKESCYEAAEAGNVVFSKAECDLAVAEAVAAHEETAPRYDAVEACEAQHGAGNCEVAQSGGGGGGMGIFMPIMMGYLMGKMMGGGLGAQPLTRGSDGRFATPAGQSFASNTGTTKVAPTSLQRPTAGRMTPAAAPTTTQTARPSAAPMSQGNVTSRGGFGGSNMGSGLGG